MKKVGTHNGVDVYEDPNAPPGTLFWLNEEWIDYYNFRPSKIKYLWYRFFKRNIIKANLFKKHYPYGASDENK